MLEPFDDKYFMREALKQAQLAFEMDEIPVGAVVVSRNKIIARAHNLTEKLTDFTAHSEMQALTSASSFLGNKYLNECTLYVTLEPCLMCAGALFWTRIGRLVYGASDQKRGMNQIQHKVLHPATKVEGGIMADECSALLSEFFRKKRD